MCSSEGDDAQHTHIHTHIPTHTHTHTHTNTYTHKHIHTQTHTHMHTHIHIHVPQVPYCGVDAHAIVWGVGSQRLHLPIPAGAPDGLKILLKQCWDAVPKRRPSFDIVLKMLHVLSTTDVQFMALADDEFATARREWRAEIKAQFDLMKEQEEEKEREARYCRLLLRLLLFVVAVVCCCLDCVATLGGCFFFPLLLRLTPSTPSPPSPFAGCCSLAGSLCVCRRQNEELKVAQEVQRQLTDRLQEMNEIIRKLKKKQSRSACCVLRAGTFCLFVVVWFFLCTHCMFSLLRFSPLQLLQSKEGKEAGKEAGKAQESAQPLVLPRLQAPAHARQTAKDSNG